MWNVLICSLMGITPSLDIEKIEIEHRVKSFEWALSGRFGLWRFWSRSERKNSNKSPFPSVSFAVDNLMKEMKHSVTLENCSKTELNQIFSKAIPERYSCHAFCFKFKEHSRQFSSPLLCQNFKSMNCEPDGKDQAFFTEKLDSDNQEVLL